MNRKIVVGLFMAAIFLMLAFSPIANDATSNQSSVVANSMSPQADLTSSALKSTSNPVHLDKYTYHTNIINNKIFMHFLFSINNPIKNQRITENLGFGSVYVIAHGNNINMNITIVHSNKVQAIPGDCAHEYYKYPKNHEAVLSVIKIPAITTSDIPEIIAVFGAAVATGVSDTIWAVESAALVIGSIVATMLTSITAVMLADYVALDVYASENKDPTVYFDIGASWGTQWYNFYQVGVYGEEGAFTGSANDCSSGTFIPLAIAGGHAPSGPYGAIDETLPHNSVWNPYQEPPW